MTRIEAHPRSTTTGVRAAALALLALTFSSCGPSRPEVERFHVSGRVEPGDYPDVPAVVLLDRTELRFTFSVERGRPYAESLHTRRIQVMDPRGLDLAKMLIPFDDRSVILHVLAKRIRPDGEIIEMADDRAVDMERYPSSSPAAKVYGGVASKLTKVSGVEVGDVFEIAYLRVWRDPRWVDPIRVSGALPVVRGEVVVDLPSNYDVDYRVTKMGKAVDVRPTKIPQRIQSIEGTGEGVPGWRLAWVFDRERALYPEELMPSVDALATQVHVQLKGYTLSGKRYVGYTSWDDVAAWYRELIGKGDQATGDVEGALTQIGAKSGSKREKLARIQRFLQNDIADVPTFLHLAALPVQKPGAVLSSKIGDSKDQATVALAMLRGAGIDGFPVLVSRHGSFAAVPDLPTPAPFNHVVIAVPSGGRYSFIDPATPYLPTGRLPGALQGQRGLLVRTDGSELIDLPEDPPEANKTEIVYDLAIAVDGTVSGQARASVDGLDAAMVRAALASAPPELASVVKSVLVPSGSALRWLEVLPVGGPKSMDPDATLKLQIVIGPSPLGRPLDGGGLTLALADVVGKPLPWLWREVRYTPLALPHRHTMLAKTTIDVPESLGVSELPSENVVDTAMLGIRTRFAIASGELFTEVALTVDARSLPPEEVPDLRGPTVRTWVMLDEPVMLVPGGDRGKDYGTDAF